MKKLTLLALLVLSACASASPQQRAEADADRLCGHYIDLTDEGDKKYMQCFQEHYTALLPTYLADNAARRQAVAQSLRSMQAPTVQQPYMIPSRMRTPTRTNCQTFGNQTYCDTY
jgi:hypothetical protein